MTGSTVVLLRYIQNAYNLEGIKLHYLFLGKKNKTKCHVSFWLSLLIAFKAIGQF